MNIEDFGHKPETVWYSVCHAHIELCIRKLLLASVDVSTISESPPNLYYRRTLFHSNKDFCCNYICDFTPELEWNFHIFFYISAHTVLTLVSDK